MIAGRLQEPQALREALDHGDDRHAQDRERDQHFEEREALLVEPAIHQAKWRDKVVSLTLGEFRVTERLARANGDVSYRQLYDVLKGESFIAGSGSEGYRANVRTLVKRIRQKFCDVDAEFAAIVSVPGFGYRWREEAQHGQA